MSKRKDLQPDTSGTPRDPQRVPHAEPQPQKPQQPGGRREAQGRGDAANKAGRRGER